MALCRRKSRFSPEGRGGLGDSRALSRARPRTSLLGRSPESRAAARSLRRRPPAAHPGAKAARWLASWHETWEACQRWRVGAPSGSRGFGWYVVLNPGRGAIAKARGSQICHKSASRDRALAANHRELFLSKHSRLATGYFQVKDRQTETTKFDPLTSAAKTFSRHDRFWPRFAHEWPLVPPSATSRSLTVPCSPQGSYMSSRG